MIMEAQTVSRRREKRGIAAPSYQLRVILSDSDPCIWRQLQVPGTANLGWFHAVLQVAMGWTNSHLHQFICGEDIYADPEAGLEPYGDDPPVRNENKFTLAELLNDVPQGLIYEYDFGDSWRHVVVVEKILPADSSTAGTAAICLAGSHACPPEDCGGIGGYFELLKALKNKKHPEHRSMKEWLGRPFDPEFFDIKATNNWLRKLKWPRVTESQLRKVLMARDGYQE